MQRPYEWTRMTWEAAGDRPIPREKTIRLPAQRVNRILLWTKRSLCLFILSSCCLYGWFLQRLQSSSSYTDLSGSRQHFTQQKRSKAMLQNSQEDLTQQSAGMYHEPQSGTESRPSSNGRITKQHTPIKTYREPRMLDSSTKMGSGNIQMLDKCAPKSRVRMMK